MFNFEQFEMCMNNSIFPVIKPVYISIVKILENPKCHKDESKNYSSSCESEKTMADVPFF